MVWVIFLLAARAPGINLYVKLSAVLGQCVREKAAGALFGGNERGRMRTALFNLYQSEVSMFARKQPCSELSLHLCL